VMASLPKLSEPMRSPHKLNWQIRYVVGLLVVRRTNRITVIK
jgi:hypothetical protein